MLEIIGLFLAILDFFDLTPALERSINRSRETIQNLTDSILKSDKKVENIISWFNTICFVLLSIYLFFITSGAPWAVRIIFSLIVALIGTGIYSVILIVSFTAFVLIILLPVLFMLRLMAKTKKGVIGSMGLLLALIGVIIRFQ